MTNPIMNLDMDLPVPLNPPFAPRPQLSELGRVHFIGIGGAGMSAIASLMLEASMDVSGSDKAESAAVEKLRKQGAKIGVPQSAANIRNVDSVVISTAIKEDNPELAEARSQGLRILHRSEALAATMSETRVIAVAGTHGKSTTSSMVAVTLDALGEDPSFAVGSVIAGFDTNARLGDSDAERWFVAEADESDGTFVRYRPDIAVVTNVEADHLDFYGTDERVFESFNRFVGSMAENGVLITCADDAGALDLALRARECGVHVITYGLSSQADVRLSNITSENTVCTSQLEWDFISGSEQFRGQGTLLLNVPGVHNQLNATASFICGLLTGKDAQTVLKAVATFTGTDRRFTLRGEVGGVQVFDDYAHHPTEVFRALEAGRTVAAGHNLYVVFQPHLFSRTKAFAQEFAEALSKADRAYVLDIYPARELPMEGVTSALITEAGYSEIFSATPEQALQQIIDQVAPGDVVMTVGAGNVTEYGPQLVDLLREQLEAE